LLSNLVEMLKSIATLVGVFFSLIAFSQGYWQQEVNYKIDVRLDDKNHVIRAFETFEYINNSPDKLDFIYVHIWPNAYRDHKSALGKQLYKNGETLLKFGGEEVRGGIDSLDFKVNNETVKWEYDQTHKDICKIYLNTPLAPGQRMTVSTPFKVKLPSGEISRLGHIDQSYQITQWYPKPAVYDKNGWNQIPYLNQGEFYSEYGSFDVSITLPQNYVVGATGDLQTESEIEFLTKRFADTQKKFENNEFPERKRGAKSEFPASDPRMKTIRYTQKNVHDFAWFADKRFEVLKGEVELPHSKRKVTSWAMFVPQNAKLWSKAIEYINDGTYYYSLWNGDYPYNQVTAVDGTISAGGGMEYPNVTVIGNTSNAMELEIVIVHEVGHNWFYGILGSNERVHGWMDEGLNTLNEMRYIQTKYPNNKNFSDMVLGGRFHLNDLNHHDMGDISYRMIATLGEDQPIETHSAAFTPANYGVIMYQKTGLVFFYLKYYLGEEAFDKAMSAYFEEFKFKHPQPEDLRRVLEKSSGKDLGWFFEDLIQTTNHIDYKVCRIHKHDHGTKVKVKNKGQVNGPIQVSAYKDGKEIESVWTEPVGKKGEVELKSKDFDLIQIDGNKHIPELNRSNNNYFENRFFKKCEPLKLEFLFGDHERDKNNHFWMPIIAGNAQDKLMVGAAFHNLGIPFKQNQYFIAPMFAFGSQKLVGTAEFSHTFLPKNNFKLVRLGTSVRSFGLSKSKLLNDDYYFAVMPYLYMKLGNRKDASPVSQSLVLQTIYRNDHFGLSSDQVGAFVKYDYQLKYTDHQFMLSLRADYMDNLRNNNHVARSSAEVSYRYRYLQNKMKRWVELRAFVGGNISHQHSSAFDNTYSLSLAGASGSQDLFLEEYFITRGSSGSLPGSNYWRMENMGAFKMTSNFGTTNQWLSAGNLYFQLPIKPGIFGLFADAGAFRMGDVTYGAFNAGLGLRLGSVFGMYVPFITSANLKTYNDLYAPNFTERIRFTLKINILNKPLSLSELIGG
jgi:hypothetical protein